MVNPKDDQLLGDRKGTEQTLNKLGIYSIKELTYANPQLIKRKMGGGGLHQFYHTNGIDVTNHDRHIKNPKVLATIRF